MLNWWLRYEPVVSLAEERAPRRVLDVGSGWHGLSWYWPGTVVNVDLSFTAQSRPDESERTGRAVYTTASVTTLPFADGAFDLAICMDMLEHVPDEIRGPAVRELARVARTVVIGFPAGATGHAVDRWTDSAFKALRVPTPIWLREHLEIGAQGPYPDDATVRRHLPPGSRIDRVLGNTNRWVHLVMVSLEHRTPLHLLPLAVEKATVRRRGRPLVRHRGRTYRRIYVLEPA